MWKHVTYRRTGLTHTEEHSACQDAVQVVEHEGWIVAALADGLGSLRNSQIASRTAVKCVCDLFGGEKGLDEGDICPEIILPLIQQAISDQACVENTPINEMDCTLVFAAIDKKRQLAYVGTLGDSAVCVIGTEQSAVYSDSTFFSTGTFAVMGAKSSEQLQIETIDLQQKQILGFILTSDGLEGELYTKGSTHLGKTAEFYLNTLAGDQGQEQARQLISQRIDKLTMPKDSPYGDDISIAVLSCADQPVTLPDDPTWLCTCGQRNPLQTTYCRRCHTDFMKVYPNIIFREHGGKAAFFIQLNQEPQKEAEMVAALKAPEMKAQPSQAARDNPQRQMFIGAADRKNIPKPEKTAEAVRRIEKKTPQSKEDENATSPPLQVGLLEPTEKSKPDERRLSPTGDLSRAASARRQSRMETPSSITNQKQTSRISRLIVSHLSVCFAAVAVILLAATLTASVIANRVGREEGYKRGKKAGIEYGYSLGFADGELSGQNQAKEVFQADYDAAVSQAEQEYSRRNQEHYQAGYEQGKKDADFDPQDFRFRRGSRGDEVRALQQLLRERGWKIQVDGQYGAETGKAVAEFQKRNDLPTTGAVDILTFWALLNEDGSGKNDSGETQAPLGESASKPMPVTQKEPASPSDILPGDAQIDPSDEAVENAVEAADKL